ncbi:hypothetical protein SERLA73DRAFT_79341 [Serpula lacrymans var. lacrymans S7.3]|uniref:Uncharacterized protein n=2 Tax=Serpula lacrymans var. lacrymans TaxID=341189 RepID=F8QG27_SERL3|nr:uncharacterized protein SERLADRAFT_436249 [Serpula lacrymans var. lacrymans S7.9]EGN92775.1 hypothetical protein SERLA73DRAFT_79341 [Serpula lacrymans var. lacrymans S7.3]EGO26436.1 hypothetical protein SERLADRAFT_436249 [Serpula lacrymans var. lacrymans S7.9]
MDGSALELIKKGDFKLEILTEVRMRVENRETRRAFSGQRKAGNEQPSGLIVGLFGFKEWMGFYLGGRSHLPEFTILSKASPESSVVLAGLKYRCDISAILNYAERILGT